MDYGELVKQVRDLNNGMAAMHLVLAATLAAVAAREKEPSDLIDLLERDIISRTIPLAGRDDLSPDTPNLLRSEIQRLFRRVRGNLALPK